MKEVACRAVLLAGAWGILSGLPSAARADLTSVSGTISSNAALTGVPVGVTDSVGALPFLFSQGVSIGEPPFVSSSGTDYDFSDIDSSPLFNVRFDHLRDGSLNSSASSSGDITFSISNAVAMIYALDGEYDLTGVDAFHFEMLLRDLTDNTTLFSNIQESRSTTDQVFLMGGQSGDFLNQLSGNTTDTLLAGHTFELTYNFNILSTLGGPSASASGFFNLAMRPGGGAVPAPAASLLGATGLMGLGLLRRWLA